MKKLLTAVCLFLAACATEVRQSAVPADSSLGGRLAYRYESSDMCRGCHAEIYEQYKDSMHARAFSNPLFNAQYFKEVVPRAKRDPKFAAEARKCVYCHAPALFMSYSGMIETPEQAARYETGVTCDFCHTLSGYAENGDYLQNPSGKKQGPLKSTSSHHAEYSGFLQVAEYCGSCHNATNHAGLEVKSTYKEWRESSYGKSGNVCQECHMNKYGYLRDGAAEFNKGKAAHINIGYGDTEQKTHEKLYSHAFPGAHSAAQLEDALQLEFKIGRRNADAQSKFPFVLHVNNSRSGHKMPTGSSDLRLLWLAVTAATDDGTRFPVILHSRRIAGAADYSVAGASSDDATVLGADVPAGSRLYRSVFVDGKGRQTLFQYDSVKNVFDNRLNAAEVRSEMYDVLLPKGFSGQITLTATLNYLAAPSSVTRRQKVADFKPVVISTQQKRITLVPHLTE
ncbi:MAG: hypothetical protein HY888_07975 [Deltaproteobacteria bacterium]|nr:hypothetical protein [Deltaproteobacteria bacterium]